MTPISAPNKTLPPFEGLPELAVPVALVVLPEADDVDAAVLAAAEELVLAGTSSALRVPHWAQLWDPGFC